MTTLAISPDRWTFDGTDLSSYTVLVQETGDAEDLPPLRGEDLAVPNLPGRRWAAKLPDARRLSLNLYITDMNASGGRTESTDQRQAQANLDALRLLFGKPGQKSLVHTMPDASTRTAQAEVVSFQVKEQITPRVAFLAVVDFALADPYLYAANVVDAAHAINSSPHDITFTNPGTARTNRITLDFTGPISSPRVTQVTTGIYVECLVTVASGKHLIIDCAAFTATNDGVNAIGSIRHSGDFRWLIVEPGAQTLRVTSTSPGGTLTTTAAAPYHA
jgi:hypothetical protein